MGVSVRFDCNGCDATATVPAEIAVTWTPLGDGFARVERRIPTVADVAPDGWWAFDPHTHVTYCPACRAEIEAPTPTREDNPR